MAPIPATSSASIAKSEGGLPSTAEAADVALSSSEAGVATETRVGSIREPAPVARPRAPQGGGGAPDEEALKQANNPLANMRAFNVQDYYIPEISGSDETANQLWFRYAQPIKTSFGDWLMRASLPLIRVPTTPPDSASGIGYSNVFAAYLFDTGEPSLSAGLGPLLGIPTATDDAIAPDQWSAGLAAVVFDASSSLFQWGGLLTWQQKFAGSGSQPDINLFAVQPFGMMQLGSGYYLRSTGIMTFNWENGDYVVPVGMGIGKVVKAGKTVFNFFVEPQFTVLSSGVGEPELQLFFGFNTQFLGM